MAKLLIKYMHSSSAGEMQPSKIATAAHVKQRLMFSIIVGITLAKFCFLRFNGNYDFIGHLDTSLENWYNWYSSFNASNPATYVQAARQLLSNLSSDITSGSATHRYGSGSTEEADQLQPIYGLAQCWEDISLTDCKTCLSIRIDQLFQHDPGRLGGRSLARSCIVQYEMKIFFNLAPSPPPQEQAPVPSAPPQQQAPVPAVPPQQAHIPSTGPPEKSGRKIPIILGVIGGLLFLARMSVWSSNKIKVCHIWKA